MEKAWMDRGKNTSKKAVLIEPRVVSNFCAGSLFILVELMTYFMCKRKYFRIHSPQETILAKSWSPLERVYASTWLVSLLK